MNTVPRRNSWILLLQLGLAAAGYYLVARLGQLLAQPPGIVPLFWPAAGLALAAVLLGGWPMGIGIWAGGFLAAFGALAGPAAAPAAAAAALGDVLQAWLSAWALGRWVGDAPPRSAGRAAAALAVTGLGALAAPALGVAGLALGGYTAVSQVGAVFWTWWLGEYAGALLVAPGLVVLARRMRGDRPSVQMTWVLAGFSLGLTLLAFVWFGGIENERLAHSLQDDAAEMVGEIRGRVLQSEIELDGVRGFLAVKPQAGRVDFDRFLASYLASGEPIRAIGWAPRVSAEERLAFERARQAEGLAGFQIQEMDASGHPMPAAGRDAFFPCTYFSPFDANQASLGLDLASEPMRRAALERARDTGQLTLTPPLVQAPQLDGQPSVMLVLPVYRPGLPAGTAAERRASLAGVAYASLPMTQVVSAALAAMTPHDIELHVFDVTEAQPQRLVYRPSLSGRASIDPAADPIQLQTDDAYREEVDVFGRTWLVVARPGPDYAAQVRRTGPWSLMAAGVVLTLAFLGFESVRQRSEARLREAEHRYRALVEHSPAIVYDDEAGGEWRYLSPKTTAMLGYRPEEFQGRRDLWIERIDPRDRDEFRQAVAAALREGGALRAEYRFRAADGRVLWLRDEADVSRDAGSGAFVLQGVVYDITARRRAESERQALYEIARGLAGNPDMPQAYRLVHGALATVLGAGSFSVVLAHPETGELEAVYDGEPHAPEFASPAAPGFRLAAHVLSSGQACILTGERLAELAGADEAPAGPLRAGWLAASLRQRGHPTGVVAFLGERASGGAPDQDLRFLDSVAAQVAVALERHQAGEVLRRSQALYQLIADNTADVIWLYDPEAGRFTFVSPAVQKLRGFTSDEAQAQRMEEVFPPEALRRLGELLAQRRALPEATYVDEVEQLRKDGSSVDTEVTTTFIRDSAGRLQIVGVSRDITERRRSEEALRAQGRALEGSLTALVMADLSGRITYANPAFLKLWGYADLAPVLGQLSADIWQSPEEAGRVIALLPEVGSWNGQMRARRPDGSTFDVQVAASMVLDAAGRPQAMVASLVDVTERNRIEHELRERLKELTCLRQTQQLLERQPPQAEACLEIARFLVAAMQYPAMAAAAVEVDEQHYQAGADPAAGAAPAPRLRASLTFGGQARGRVTVWYQQAHLTFMPEEANLLEGVAHTLGLWLERRQNEAALRAGEARYRRIFEGAPVGMWEEDFSAVWPLLDRLRADRIPNLRQYLGERPEVVRQAMEAVVVLDVNQAGRRLHGLAETGSLPAEQRSIGWRTPPEVFLEEMASLVEGARHFGMDAVNRTVEGQPLEVWLTLAVPLARTDPVVVTTVDVSGLRRAETALREAQTLYRTIFDVSLDGLAVFDADWRLRLVNKRGAELAGFASPEAMVGLRIARLVAPEDRRRMMKATSRQMIDGLAHGEFLAQRADGARFPAEFALIRIPAPAGQSAGMVIGVLRDIAARKREAALQAAQLAVTRQLIEAPTIQAAASAVLRTLVEKLGWQAGALWELDEPAGSMRLNANWALPDAGPEAVPEFCRQEVVAPGDGIVGEVWSGARPLWLAEPRQPQPTERGPGVPAAKVQLRLPSVVGVPIQAEAAVRGVLVLSQAAPRPVEPDQLTVLASIGRQVGLFVARRLSDEALVQERNSLARRVAERTADLANANAELARAARLKDEFLSSMSHELRTPLNGILSLSESLEEGVYGALAPQQLPALKSVSEAGHHLLDLINDILDISKIEAGKLELRLELVSVEEVCRSSLRLIRQPAVQKNLRVALALDDAPEAVLADARRLKQMLVNLLGNAVKFTLEGGEIGLEITQDRGAGRVRFTVWDTGIGVAPEKIPLLFQPFSQVDSSLARQYGGTGLGLSLVSRLAELHGGSVGVQSEPGRGSRFFVDLPLQPTGQRPAPPGFGRVRSALVVGAPGSAGPALARILEDLGARVAQEPGGAGAAASAAAGRAEVIFLALPLADRTGAQVLDDLGADPRTQGLPVVLVSAGEEPVRALEARAAAHLVGPPSAQVVGRILESLPAAPAAARPAVAAARPAAAAGVRPLLLLAEDNPINQAAMRDFLTAKGFQVAVAGTGAEALERARQEKPALILMDVQMPLMDGLEATRQLRADPAFAHTPIIMVTALAMPGDRERCLAAGANDYLTKPVNWKRLLRALDDWLPRPPPEADLSPAGSNEGPR